MSQRPTLQLPVPVTTFPIHVEVSWPSAFVGAAANASSAKGINQARFPFDEGFAFKSGRFALGIMRRACFCRPFANGSRIRKGEGKLRNPGMRCVRCCIRNCVSDGGAEG